MAFLEEKNIHKWYKLSSILSVNLYLRLYENVQMI